MNTAAVGGAKRKHDAGAAATPKVRSRGPSWTVEEEQHLKAVQAEFGKGKWDAKAARLGTGRSGRSVSQHWAIMEKKAATATYNR